MAEVYDTSDVRRQLALIKQEMDEARAARQRGARGAMDVASSGVKMWGESQKTKLAELLAMKTPAGDKALYQMNPEYMKKGMLGRFFTPAAGKVSAIDPKVTPAAPGSQTLKDAVGKSLDLSKYSKITGGIGVAAGLASMTDPDFNKRSDISQIGSIASTGLGAAELAGLSIPGAGWLTLGAGALGLFG